MGFRVESSNAKRIGINEYITYYIISSESFLIIYDSLHNPLLYPWLPMVFHSFLLNCNEITTLCYTLHLLWIAICFKYISVWFDQINRVHRFEITWGWACHVAYFSIEFIKHINVFRMHKMASSSLVFPKILLSSCIVGSFMRPILFQKQVIKHFVNINKI